MKLIWWRVLHRKWHDFFDGDIGFVLLLIIGSYFLYQDWTAPHARIGAPCGPGYTWQVVGDGFRGLDLSCERKPPLQFSDSQ